jgi:hypothetical protein
MSLDAPERLAFQRRATISSLQHVPRHDRGTLGTDRTVGPQDETEGNIVRRSY